MNRMQLELVPDAALRNTGHLLEWLRERGWTMSLAELEAERRRRGIDLGRRFR